MPIWAVDFTFGELAVAHRLTAPEDPVDLIGAIQSRLEAIVGVEARERHMSGLATWLARSYARRLSKMSPQRFCLWLARHWNEDKPTEPETHFSLGILARLSEKLCCRRFVRRAIELEILRKLEV